MLNQERIPIGRVRQAYRLDAQHAGLLISAIASQGCVDLYELWHEAERFVAIEDNNKRSLYDEVVEPHFPGVSDLGQDLLQQRIATKRLLRHYLYSARGGKAREHLQRIFDRVLHFAYDEPDQKQIDAVNRMLDMIYEQQHFGYHGKNKVDIAWVYVSPELFAEFCSLYDDAVSADKQAAVLWLDEQGYSQERSVKGLSKELVKRMLANAPADGAQAAPETRPSSPPSATISVPRSLWEGKTRRAVREAMRKEEFSDAVITHILFTRCDVPKTEIASLLDTNTKRVRAFLEETASMNIVDS